MRRISRIIVHHTAGPEVVSVDAIERAHVARGFASIGYHWLVHRSPGGQVLISAGRGEALPGAHDAGQNADSIGIAIAGNYSAGPVPPDLWWAAAAAVASICRRFGLPVDAIEGHRDNEPPSTPTECPGDFLDLTEFRDSVATVINGWRP